MRSPSAPSPGTAPASAGGLQDPRRACQSGLRRHRRHHAHAQPHHPLVALPSLRCSSAVPYISGLPCCAAGVRERPIDRCLPTLSEPISVTLERLYRTPDGLPSAAGPCRLCAAASAARHRRSHRHRHRRPVGRRLSPLAATKKARPRLPTMCRAPGAGPWRRDTGRPCDGPAAPPPFVFAAGRAVALRLGLVDGDVAALDSRCRSAP
jgi:hypothetical protein